MQSFAFVDLPKELTLTGNTQTWYTHTACESRKKNVLNYSLQSYRIENDVDVIDNVDFNKFIQFSVSNNTHP